VDLGPDRSPAVGEREGQRAVGVLLEERGELGAPLGIDALGAADMALDAAVLDEIGEREPEDLVGLPIDEAARPRESVEERLGRDDEAEAKTGGDHAFWLTGVSAEEKRRAILASSIVAARNTEGRIVAFARAVSDGLVAWIYDVVVSPEARGRGLGTWLVGRMLDHPAVRRARSARLSTRDAMGLYERFGFRAFAVARIRSTHDSTFMIRPSDATKER